MEVLGSIYFQCMHKSCEMRDAMTIKLDSPINERYDHLLAVISSRRFLNNEGLGLEVPFFICPFKPEEYAAMMKLIAQLTKQLENKGVHVLCIDLYDLCIDLLKLKGKWTDILEREPNLPKDQLLELLQNWLDPKKYIIPAIDEKIQKEKPDVVFLKGVGEVFPYLRSHTILENLQSAIKDKPVVMFFPGDYVQTENGNTSLVLFGRLRSKYYRASNIYHYHI